MADDYTPSINALRADYIALHTRNFDSYMTGRSLTSEQEHYGREFDAALAAIKAEQVNSGEEAVQRLARATFLVDSRHHIRVIDGTPKCLCGFVGNARARTQTEHITSVVLEAFDHD